MKKFTEYIKEEKKEAPKVREVNGILVRTDGHYDVHGINDDHLEHITKQVRDSDKVENAVTFPDSLPKLKNAIVGPAAGDPPVPDEMTHSANRGRDWDSRMIHGEHRDTNQVTAIVIPHPEIKGKKWLVTAYGGPPAPREPKDPSHPNEESRKESEKFWSQHALLTGKPEPKNEDISMTGRMRKYLWKEYDL